MHLYSRTKSKKAKLKKVEIFESETIQYNTIYLGQVSSNEDS